MQPNRKAIHNDGGVRLLAASAILTILINLLFAYQIYPVADGDATAFAPAALDVNVNGTLFNRVSKLSYDTDPLQLGRFLYYPPLFPIIVGKLSVWLGIEGYAGIFVAMALIRAIGIVAFALILIDIYRTAIERNPSSRLLWLGLSCGVLLSYGLFIFPTNGRPEVLTITLITLSLWIEYFKVKWGFVGQLLLIPLTISTSLVGGGILLTIYTIYLLHQNYSERQVIGRGLLLMVISTIVMYLSYALAGVNIADSLYAIRQRAAMDIRRTDGSLALLVRYYWTWVLFCGLAFLHAAPALAQTFQKSSLFRKVLLGLASLLLAFEFWFFGIRVAPMHYNLYSFLPVFQVLGLTYVYQRQAQGKAKLLYAAVTPMCVTAIMLSLLIPGRAIALYPYYLASGKSFRNARTTYEDILSSNHQCNIMYTTGLSVVDEVLQGRIYPQFSIEQGVSVAGNPCTIVLVQQVNGAASWLEVPGSEEIVDWSDESAIYSLLKKLHVLNNPQGYSFRGFRVENPTR